MCLRIEHDEDSSIPDDCSCGAEEKVLTTITEAVGPALELARLEGRIAELWNPNLRLPEREKPITARIKDLNAQKTKLLAKGADDAKKTDHTSADPGN